MLVQIGLFDAAGKVEPHAKRFRRKLKGLIEPLLIPALRSYFRYAPTSLGKTPIWGFMVQRLDGQHSVANVKWGANLEVDVRDACGRKIYFFGVWEPNLTAFVQRRLRHGDAFIDVGANIGYFAVLASKLVGQGGKAVAVEAIPTTYDVLLRNLKRNAALNVRSINQAASDKNEKLEFFTSPDSVVGTSTISKSFGERHGLFARCTVDAAPLCSVLMPEEIRSARIVKVDVEGAELKVMLGLQELLQHGRADLEFAIEVQATSFSQVTSFFRQYGFNAYHMPNDYSAEAYIRPQIAAKLPRITTLPSRLLDMDLIFSRIDAGSLPV
jgi:FkbM family methyltransferase